MSERPAPDVLDQLRRMDVDAMLSDPSRKQAFVTPMFDVIAPRYDEFSRRFSFGMDRAWKGELLSIADAAAGERGRVLDVACGTGDLALALSSPNRVTRGVDASKAMIEGARRRAHAAHSSVTFEVGDLCHLDLPNDSVDVITAGYAFRNVPDIRAALAEMARVLAPGGTLCVLDFYLPTSRWWRPLFLTYLRLAGDVVGWRWYRTPVVYGYIARSVAAYVTADQFSLALTDAGFDVPRMRRKLLGGVALHAATKRR